MNPSTISPACIHRGDQVRVELCPTCQGKVEVKVFACAKHSECTLVKPIDGIKCCSNPACTERVEPALDELAVTMLRAEELTQDSPVDRVEALFEFGPVGPFAGGWEGWENVKQAHIRLVEKEVAKNRVYPGGFSGRGILSCVSAKPGYSSGKHLENGYLPGAWVMAKELRRLGCDLPITFAHLGHVEWDAYLTKLVGTLGVEVIDLLEWQKKNPMRILAGWETKIAAVLACRYEEVLFMDADNIPVRNPAALFDDPRYQEKGAIFWPDLPPHDRREWLPKEVWNNFGMEYRNEVDFESGQLLINKAKCWRETMLCKHINEHSDWVYKFVFGDKSTFHIAWAKLDRPYAMPQRGAGWNGGAILQYDLNGNLLFEHGAQNKPTLLDFPHGKECLSNPGECHRHLAELRELWDGKLWYNEKPIGMDAATTSRLIGKTFNYKRIGLGERPIRLLQDNRIGKGAARCEFSWSIVGDVLSVCDIDGKPTMLLREGSDGVWRGHWLEHEKCAVELTPA